MNTKRFRDLGVTAACIGLALIGAGAVSAAYADDSDADQARIRKGFESVPVMLNLKGKDRDLVYLGSYWVNVVGNCNMCHSAGPSTEYAPGGNPYYGQPKVVNSNTYLGGGRSFAPQVAGNPSVVSRNLTPDKTGRPAGGMTFAAFREVLRTGVDLDHVHPNCSATVSAPCFNPPFDGDLLQVMPWPGLQNLTDQDLLAIYEYLSAIPCITGPPTGLLHNECT